MPSITATRVPRIHVFGGADCQIALRPTLGTLTIISDFRLFRKAQAIYEMAARAERERSVSVRVTEVRQGREELLIQSLGID